jgi:6-phosphogluconolactonase
MTSELRMEVLKTDDAVANRAAQAIAALAREAIEARGRFLLAVSGGHTPWVMLRALAAEQIPWPAVRVFQVDERVARAGHADRNLTHLKDSLLERAPLSPEQILTMPVEGEDLDRAAAEYAQMLQRECGSPAVLDLVHLGLGPMGTRHHCCRAIRC